VREQCLQDQTFKNKIAFLVARLKMKTVHLEQGRSQKFILGGYNFLLHDTTVLYTSSLTTLAAISAQNNFQGLILGGYIYRYTPRRYAPDLETTFRGLSNCPVFCATAVLSP